MQIVGCTRGKTTSNVLRSYGRCEQCLCTFYIIMITMSTRLVKLVNSKYSIIRVGRHLPPLLRTNRHACLIFDPISRLPAMNHPIPIVDSLRAVCFIFGFCYLQKSSNQLLLQPCRRVAVTYSVDPMTMTFIHGTH